MSVGSGAIGDGQRTGLSSAKVEALDDAPAGDTSLFFDDPAETAMPQPASAPTPHRSMADVAEATSTPTADAEAVVPRRPNASLTPALRLGARFATATSALVFAAQLSRLGLEQPEFSADPESYRWWVFVTMPLRLARELADTCRGELFVETGGRLRPDRGWGPAPATGGAPSDRSTPVPGAEHRVELLDLVNRAGLRYRPARGVREVVVLAPGARITRVIRRCLDLGLATEYRTVSLSPLFGSAEGAPSDGDFGPENGGRGDVRVELSIRVQAGADARATIPASLLAALNHDPGVLLCRRAAPNLLMQYEQACPLEDLQVAALVDEGTWVLADKPHGCSRLRSSAVAADGIELVRHEDGRRLVPAAHRPAETGGQPESRTGPEPIPVRIVAAATRGMPVDAILLSDSDLPLLALLLEGHPVAEHAYLARGRDRHLLFASAGRVKDVAIGLPLYCLGPGPLYLPLGHRTSPVLPSAARLALFEPDEQTAVVLTRDVTYEFALADPEPVWRLWVGAVPPVDLRLPRRTARALSATDKTPAAKRGGWRAAPIQRTTSSGETLTWRDGALEAERRGDLVSAAEVHEQHGDHLGAAQLYERAAHERAPRGKSAHDENEGDR